MITGIENFTKKSFSNFTSLNIFKEKNILFGYNGRGKSSLAQGVYELGCEKYGKDNVRYFHRDYVQEVLLLTDTDESISGVKATFSKHDVDIQNEIEELKKQIKDLSGNFQYIKQIRESIHDQINEIYNSKKGNLKIQKKPIKIKEKTGIHKTDDFLNIEYILTLYKQNLTDALKIEQDIDRLRSYRGDHQLKETYDKVNGIKLPNFYSININSHPLTELTSVLSKPYFKNNIPSLKIIKWITEGLSLHTEGSISNECFFCKSKNISIQDIENQLNIFNKNEEQKGRVILSNYLQEIDNLIGGLENSSIYEQSLLTFICPDEVNRLLDFKNQIYMYSVLKKAIKHKLSNMESTITISDYFTQKLIETNSIVTNRNEELITLKANFLDDLTNKIHFQNLLVNGSIGLELEENSQIIQLLQDLNSLEEITKTDLENNLKLQSDIQVLEEQKSEYTDFMEFLNETLTDLGLQIELNLEQSKNSYYLKHKVDRKSLSVNNISEGEKNLLALLFFYFELFNDNEQNLVKENIKLLIIDDPISSLDDGNKMYVLEIIKYVLDCNFEQTFIMTHSWNDFCDITYGKKGEEEYSLLEVYKNSAYNSELRPISNTVTPYKKLLQEIYQIREKHSKGTLELSDCDIYHSANSMRRVFEEFLKFKSPTGIVPTRASQQKITDIYSKSGNKISSRFPTRLGEFLSFINILSHRAMRSDEIPKNAAFLLNFIEKVDEVHFNAMKQSNE